MTSHMTHLRAQHHIADLQRAADHRWPADTTNAKPARPRRAFTLHRWIVLSLLTALRIS
jgi:hypothetical protein